MAEKTVHVITTGKDSGIVLRVFTSYKKAVKYARENYPMFINGKQEFLYMQSGIPFNGK